MLGVLLAMLIVRTPKGEPLFSAVTKVLLILLGVLWMAIVLFFALFATWQLPYMLGQYIATLLIVAFIALIGFWFRNRA